MVSCINKSTLDLCNVMCVKLLISMIPYQLAMYFYQSVFKFVYGNSPTQPRFAMEEDVNSDVTLSCHHHSNIWSIDYILMNVTASS